MTMEPSILQTYKCQNCGAAMVEALNGSFTCTHCGSVYHPSQGNNTLLAGQTATNAGTPDPAPIPRDIALGYNKKKRWHPLLWGVMVWLIYGLLRSILTGYLFENSIGGSEIFNNPFVSPPGGLFWIVRSILFLGILPLIICLIRRGKQPS